MLYKVANPISNIEIQIPDTRKQKKPGVFNKTYTVNFTQEYYIQAKLPNGDTITQYKRYRDIYRHYVKVSFTKIQTVARNKGITLPQFPGKQMSKLKNDVIQKRRQMIQAWLQAVFNYRSLAKRCMKFLNLPRRPPSPKSEPVQFTQSEEIIIDFLHKIKSEQNNKIRTLETFDIRFFQIKRQERSSVIVRLFETLIPLCSDGVIGAKCMYVLNKLMQIDSNRHYRQYITEFAKFPCQFVSLMQLNRHILKKVQKGFSEKYALEICLIYDNENEYNSIQEILNYDSEAYQVFKKWKDQDIIPLNKIRKIEKEQLDTQWQQVRSGLLYDFIKVKYRYVKQKIEIQMELEINAQISTIVNLITLPELRSQWDQKLDTIEQLDSNLYRYTYILDRSKFDVQETVNVEYSQDGATIFFNTLDDDGYEWNSKYELQVDPQFCDVMTLENIDEWVDTPES